MSCRFSNIFIAASRCSIAEPVIKPTFIFIVVDPPPDVLGNWLFGITSDPLGRFTNSGPRSPTTANPPEKF